MKALIQYLENCTIGEFVLAILVAAAVLGIIVDLLKSEK